jgi:hypothetical protein
MWMGDGAVAPGADTGAGADQESKAGDPTLDMTGDIDVRAGRPTES